MNQPERSQPVEKSAGISSRTMERVVVGKLVWRLVPFMFVLYIVAYLDRINVGFAALEMNRQLGLSPEAFGLGAGLFFIGYMIFEIPSNLILARVGARRWIARIMVSWGVVAVAMAAVRGERSFYLLRFTLGIAEAGFFPGIIFYMTGWFPAREQARAIALFMTATALAGVIGGPVSGALLTLDGAFGLAGWQWLFVSEGLPAIVLGIVVLFHLPDSPAQAPWLDDTERQWLEGRLAQERRQREQMGLQELSRVFSRGVVWALSALYFLIVTGIYGVSMWLPQIVKGLRDLSNLQVGLLSAIPFLAAAIAMVIAGRSSDRRGERRWHVALAAMAGAAGFVLSACTTQPALELAALSIGAAGVCSTLGPFWAMPASFLSGPAAAGGIALINSVGNLGGFAGPYGIGLIRQTTHSFGAALLAIAIAVAAGGLLAVSIPAVGSDRPR